MRLCTIGFTPELAEVYQSMKSYMSIVERYEDGTATELDMSRISDQRNLVQYYLVSLHQCNDLTGNLSNSSGLRGMPPHGSNIWCRCDLSPPS